MQYRRSGDVIALRLEPGEEVHASLAEAARQSGISQAFVVSGIGHLHKVTLSYFIGKGEYASSDFPEGGELLSLAGNLVLKDGEPFFHLHALLGRDNYSVFGGHLAAGVADVTLEVMLLVVGDEVKMHREPDEATGLHALMID